MDHCVAQLYSEILAYENPIMDVVPRGNFVLVRVVGHDYCKEAYSIFLRPVGMAVDDTRFIAFQEWAKQEYPGTHCCCCDDYDDYSGDWEEDYYDVVHDDEMRKITKQERRDMRNKNYRDRDGRYR